MTARIESPVRVGVDYFEHTIPSQFSFPQFCSAHRFIGEIANTEGSQIHSNLISSGS